ncbi:MAG: PTS transporter subunit EIIC [Selenomonas sp.]|nr:PTS transporter subunit EIIC [Selenomonas sp.]
MTSIILAAIFGVIWGPCQAAIHAVGEWIIGAGVVGTFVYGVLNRLLIPIGLHHILNSFIWFVFGEYTTPAGVVATGDLNRFFAGDPHAGMFMGGFYIMMMFGMPAVALAMYRAAKPENRSKVGGALASVAFTAFLTGITEPIEFMFMFLAPALYAVHAVLTGIALSVSYSLGILHGFGLLGWFHRLCPELGPGYQADADHSRSGLVFAVIYYVIFSWAIRHFDIPTIGRYDEEATIDEDTDMDEYTQQMIEKLGGLENLEEVGSCITRLRLKVSDADKVDDAALKAMGAKGVIKKGTAVQVVIGTRAELIANEINASMKK